MATRRKPALVLGTAQWGLSYGVTNMDGRLSDGSVGAVLAVLPELEVTLLDTAPAYGDAETRIGELAPGIAVQTKASGAVDPRSSLATSARRLGRAPVRLVLHDWPTLDEGARRSAACALEALREEGLVQLVGISGYDSTDLAAGLEHFDRLDLVQLPGVAPGPATRRVTGDRPDKGGRGPRAGTQRVPPGSGTQQSRAHSPRRPSGPRTPARVVPNQGDRRGCSVPLLRPFAGVDRRDRGRRDVIAGVAGLGGVG